jgi:MOSC domain-containing protein YiiM
MERDLRAVVVAVSRAAMHGFAKQEQTSILLVQGEGVDGDAHRGVTVQHLYQVRRDPTQPNLCQVHLFAEEMLQELDRAGFALRPGELGENVLTRGVDLLHLPRGTRVLLGPEAVVEITGLRTPCTKIDAYRAGLQAHLWGQRGRDGKRQRRAGVMAVVLRGGQVREGDELVVELPPKPHVPLGPV